MNVEFIQTEQSEKAKQKMRRALYFMVNNHGIQ